MKKEYDFSNAEQGKFYVPLEKLDVPIHLDPDILEFLSKICVNKHEDLQTVVNKLLRHEIEIVKNII